MTITERSQVSGRARVAALRRRNLLLTLQGHYRRDAIDLATDELVEALTRIQMPHGIAYVFADADSTMRFASSYRADAS